MTTKRQKAAIKFITHELNVVFKGDINNFQEVSIFIGKYLEDAKESYDWRCMEALGSIGDTYFG